MFSQETFTKTLLIQNIKTYLGGELMPSKMLFLASTVLFVLVTFPLINAVGASLEMWSQTYGGEHGNVVYTFDIAYSLVQTSDGGYALAGLTKSFGAGATDFWLVKTDAQGIPEFPLWIILPLLLVATLLILICKQRLPKISSNGCDGCLSRG